MGYVLFATQKLHYTNMVSLYTRQLNEIMHEKENLINFSANIEDGMITAEELASDPLNMNNYIEFMNGAQVFKSSEEGGGDVEPMMNELYQQEAKDKVDQRKLAILQENLNKKLDREYAKSISKKLTARELVLDQKQKVLETKLTAAQQQLQAIQQAEGRAIQEATPKYAGLA